MTTPSAPYPAEEIAMPHRFARPRPAVLTVTALSTVVVLTTTLLGGCRTAADDSVAVPKTRSTQAGTGVATRPVGDQLSVVVADTAAPAPSSGTASSSTQSTGTDDDPPLDTAGQERAKKLAVRLAGEPGVAVYVTPFQRAQSTAMPTANVWQVAPSLYDPTGPVREFVARVRADNARGTVLIVGARDETAGLVAALCSCDVDDDPQLRTADTYRLTFATDGSLIGTGQVQDF